MRKITQPLRKTLSFLTVFALLLSTVMLYEPYNIVNYHASANTSTTFTITNPYAGVNWNTYNQYKAGTHTHSTNSDGSDTIAAMAERHYELGYNIVSVNDHNVTTFSPDQTPTSSNGGYNGLPQTPLTSARVTQMAAGQGRTGGSSNGMLFVPNGNERDTQLPSVFPRRTAHVNTYWSNASNPSSPHSEPISTMLGRINTEGTGLAVLNHIGRNTGTVYSETNPDNGTQNWQVAKSRMSNTSYVSAYTDLLRSHPRLIGMEIINEFDNESQASEVMWDNILTQLMPEERTVWGFSADDSHTWRNVGWSYNIMLMPELSMSAFRNSMENGAFFGFSRVNRRYGIYAGTIIASDTRGATANYSRISPVLDLPTPEITSITTTSDSITINAINHEFINWYADGNLIHTGATLDLTAHQGNINSYVRATVGHSEYGVLYTQPFGIKIEGDILYTNYNMQTDPNLNLFAGNGSSQPSTHPLLTSNSGNRVVNTTSNPRTITITGRGGTSQGVDIRLANLLTKPEHSYKFEFTGRVTTGTGTHSLFINAVSGDSGAGSNVGSSLATASAATNAAFTLSYTAAHEEIAAFLATPNGVRRFRLGGASMQTLVVTGITITEIPPSDGTIYNMQTDPNLPLFTAGTHPLLANIRSVGSNNRIVNMNTTPKTITLLNRGGTSQGIDILLPALNSMTKLEHSYTIEFTGRVDATSGTTHSIFLQTAIGSTAGSNLTPTVTTGTNGEFTISVTLTKEEIAVDAAVADQTYRIGGANQQNLIITGIVITEFLTNDVQVYTITFNPQGGTVSPTTAKTGTEGRLESLPVPLKQGYTFNGWFTSATGGTEITLDRVYTEDTEIHAQWTAITHTVTFNPNNGSVTPNSATTDITGKLAMSELPTPTRTGFAFNGWFTSISGGTEVTIDRVYTEDTTIYAQWSQIYTVTFNPQEGTVSPTTAQTGKNGRLTLTSMPTPVRSGFNFTGWFTSPSGGTAVDLNWQYTEDTAIYAHWSSTSIEVTFDAKEGTVFPASATVGSDGKLAELPTPARTGFAFNGWFTSVSGGTEVTIDRVYSENATIYAQWSQIRTVTFNTQGGTLPGGFPTTVQTGKNGRLTLSELPVPTKDGFTFNGWFTEQTGGNEVTLDRQYTVDTTIYAQWTSLTVTITFDANGGTVNPTSAVVEINGKLSSLPIPTKPGFGFDGWFTEVDGGESVTADRIYNESTTIFALWFAITVSFDAQGGEVFPTSATVNTENRLTELPTPVKGGHIFAGWFTESDGGELVTLNKVYNDNTTVFAAWLVITVTFDAQGGEVFPESMTVNDENRLTELPLPAKQGFDFVGWFTKDENDQTGESVTLAAVYSEDTTIFAHWTPQTQDFVFEIIKSDGEDWVEIHNLTIQPISTKGLYLTDNENDLFKWQMPSFIIQPGVPLVIKGVDNDVTPAFKRARVNFDMMIAENLFLVDAAGVVESRWDLS